VDAEAADPAASVRPERLGIDHFLGGGEDLPSPIEVAGIDIRVRQG
jgi:hypothetical protein